ncbi:MAG TPA: DUF711 family protein [Longilinea sp.]|nr:DUF711 family protein [Longilinea sp.]
MKIRSITCFYNPGVNFAGQTLEKLSQLTVKLRAAIEAEGISVQTTRLATPPFSRLCPSDCFESGSELAQKLERQSKQHGFDYLSMGPAFPDRLDTYTLIPRLLAQTKDVFFSGSMTTAQGKISLPAVKACAEVIEANARVTPDGFTNLHFAALANVPAFTPFFPAAYMEGEQPAFSLAVESADEAVQAFSQAKTLAAARTSLMEKLESQTAWLTVICEKLAKELDCIFKGFDVSLAPFPTKEVSLGGALEKLGVPALGNHGSLAAAAFLAETLDRGNWLRAGFNGLMLPVLEDSTLAERAAGGSLTVRDLLLYSSVCGAGLDTIPLAGDITAAQIYPLLLDVAFLSTRLHKPLTVRLMPIPGKKAGDATTFEFDYFANSRVMAIDSEPLFGVLTGNEEVEINPRH